MNINLKIKEKEDSIIGKKEEINEDNKENDEENENKENNLKNEEENNKDNVKDNEMKKEIAKKKVKQVIKTIRFWRLSTISFFLNIAISFTNNTARTFGALIGINGNALQFASMLQVLAVLLVAPLIGTIVDKKGPLVILRIICISCIIPNILLIFFMSNSFIFISCYVIFVLNVVGLLVSFSPFIMEVYGIQESVILGGIMSGFSKLGDILTTVSAFGFSLICDNEKDCLKLRYAYMYCICGMCCAISSILLFIENKEKYNYDNFSIDKSDSENENKQKIEMNQI